MTRMRIFGLLAAASLAAMPAMATPLLSPSTDVPFTPFDPADLGTLEGTVVYSVNERTFAGELRNAVYRNAGGTLDFLFQWDYTAPGTSGSATAIRRMSIFDFRGFTVDAQFSDADLDGAGGIFTAADNLGTPATADRDGTIGVNFDFSNRVTLGETSSIFVFRTNATSFDQNGTGSVIDGSTFTGDTFQPIAAVPEPATWTAMVIGFGALGATVRRRRVKARIVAV